MRLFERGPWCDRCAQKLGMSWLDRLCATCGPEVELEVEADLATIADPRPCRGVNVNICNAEGCFGEACRLEGA